MALCGVSNHGCDIGGFFGPAPEGELFVMGDNRNHSEDSRFSDVGCVKKEAVLGKVLFVVFPGRQTNEYGTVTGGRSWHRFGAVS